MGIFNAKKTSDDENVVEDEKKEEKSMKDLYSETSDNKKENVKEDGIAYRVLVKPLVTEKAANLGELNKYAFVVSNSSNKVEVSKAIFEVYGVKPTDVNVIKVKGKRVVRGKVKGKKKDFKKAIITLKKGDSISIYEGV